MGGASDATEAPDNGLTGNQLIAAICDAMHELSFQERIRQYEGIWAGRATTMEEARSKREAAAIFMEWVRFCGYP